MAVPGADEVVVYLGCEGGLHCYNHAPHSPLMAEALTHLSVGLYNMMIEEQRVARGDAALVFHALDAANLIMPVYVTHLAFSGHGPPAGPELEAMYRRRMAALPLADQRIYTVAFEDQRPVRFASYILPADAAAALRTVDPALADAPVPMGPVISAATTKLIPYAL